MRAPPAEDLADRSNGLHIHSTGLHSSGRLFASRPQAQTGASACRTVSATGRHEHGKASTMKYSLLHNVWPGIACRASLIQRGMPLHVRRRRHQPRRLRMAILSSTDEDEQPSLREVNAIDRGAELRRLVPPAVRLHGPGLHGLGRLHGPRQLGDRPRRRRAVRLHAAVRHHAVEPDGDPAAGAVPPGSASPPAATSPRPAAPTIRARSTSCCGSPASSRSSPATSPR